jgi:hypothetical protein
MGLLLLPVGLALTTADGVFASGAIGNLYSGAQDLIATPPAAYPKSWSTKSLATTMIRHSVDVFGQGYALNVYQHADNLWIAVGEFLGHQLRTIDRTALKAVRAWRKAAIEKRLFDEVG